MTTLSVSQLKVNPSALFKLGEDFPVALQNRGKTQGYYFARDIAEKMIELLEDIEDKRAIKKINLKEKVDFDDLASELGI